MKTRHPIALRHSVLCCSNTRIYSMLTPHLQVLHMSAWDMVWLRSVGSIELQVSFAKYRLFYKALLQKRPMILSIRLTKATPQCESLLILSVIIHFCSSLCTCYYMLATYKNTFFNATATASLYRCWWEILRDSLLILFVVIYVVIYVVLYV